MAKPESGTGTNVPNTGALAQLAWVALEHAPRAADPLLHVGRRWVLPLARARLAVERRCGKTRSGEPVSLLLIGRGMQLEYLSRRLFAEPPGREALPSVGLHRLGRRLGRALDEADLVVALVPRAFAPALAGRDFLHVPASLDFVLSTGGAELAAASPSLRQRVKAVRASGLRPRVSTDPSEFERFYDDFHLPLVTARFGGLAVRQPRRVLRRRFRSGGLIWVERDGEPLCADLFETRGSEFNMLVHGARLDCDPAEAMFAHRANYLFGLEHGRALGCRTVNLGGTLPVLTDGVARHKRAWGATARPRHDTHLALLVGWRRPAPGVLRFLADAPLVAHGRDGLTALAAVEGDAPADPHDAVRLNRGLMPEGVRQLTVLAAAGWAEVARGNPMPPADRLRLASAGSSTELRAVFDND
jgi:hypothetical protein